MPNEIESNYRMNTFNQNANRQETIIARSIGTFLGKKKQIIRCAEVQGVENPQQVGAATYANCLIVRRRPPLWLEAINLRDHPRIIQRRRRRSSKQMLDIEYNWRGPLSPRVRCPRHCRVDS